MSKPAHLSRIALLTTFAAMPLLAQEQPTAGDPSSTLRRELAAARTELALLRATLHADAPVHGALGVALTNEYVFRGIPQEDRGVIAQPWTELAFALHDGDYDGDDCVHDVALTLGIWNSLHDGPTGGSGSVWYEADVYVGVKAGLGEHWTAGVSYTVYHSPNGTFGTVEEIGGSVAFDDTGLGMPMALRPSLSVAFETSGQSDAGRGLGIWAELGIEPRIDIGSAGGSSFELVTPVKAGFSLGDYYEHPGGGRDRAFGYVDAAIAIASALPWLPGPGKPWTAELGLHYLLLGDSNQARNRGDDSELLVAFEMRTEF